MKITAWVLLIWFGLLAIGLGNQKTSPSETKWVLLGLFASILIVALSAGVIWGELWQ